MNNMYASKSGKPIDNKENPALRQVRKMIERQNAAREKSESIVEYYTDGKQRGIKL